MSTITIGKRIKSLRTETPGFTQELLAEAVGVTRVHITRVETGKCYPSLDLQIRIAVALDVPLAAVAEGGEPE